MVSTKFLLNLWIDSIISLKSIALEQQQKIPEKEEEAGINLKVGKLFLRNALKLCSHFRNWANTRMLGRAQCHRLLTLSTLTKRHCTTTTSNDVQKPKLKKSRPLPPTTTETQRLVREDFYRREADWEALVDFGRLTEQERVIHQCHKEAVAGTWLHIFSHVC